MADIMQELKLDADPTLDEHDVEVIRIVRRLREVAAKNPPYVNVKLHPTKARLWAAYLEELVMLRHGKTGDIG